jgi:hypothetical protein
MNRKEAVAVLTSGDPTFAADLYAPSLEALGLTDVRVKYFDFGDRYGVRATNPCTGARRAIRLKAKPALEEVIRAFSDLAPRTNIAGA